MLWKTRIYTKIQPRRFIVSFKYQGMQGGAVGAADAAGAAGAAGAKTRRSLGHHLLHPLILRPRALFLEQKFKFLTHDLPSM